MNRRFCLTLDLKDDPILIAEYKSYHQRIWPEITQSIRDSGIEDMEIYLLGTRMFMIMEVNERFSFEAKAQADGKNPKVQEWENLMWRFQPSPPSQARREMDGDGRNIQAGSLMGLVGNIHNRTLAPEVCGSDSESLF